MKILYLLSLVLLTACTGASGAKYSSDMKGNLVVYREPQQAFDPARRYSIDINGVTKCELGGNGFYLTTIQGETNISSSLWNQPGTSRITVTPSGNKKIYVKIDPNRDRVFAGAFAGLIGQGIAESANGGGPFVFHQIAAEQAKHELLEARQDCM